MVAIQSIVERAMLVSLHLGSITLSTSDKRVTRETAEANNADVEMVDTRKRLFRKQATKELTSLLAEIRQWFYRRTSPWDQDGARALSSLAYDPFVGEAHDYEAKLYDVATRFLDVYDSEVDASMGKLGTMGQRDLYPSRDKLRSRLKMTWEIRPIPTAGDFRVDMSAEHVSALRQSIEQQMEDKTREAMASIYSRIQEAVRDFAGKLKAYDPTQPKAHPFRDSVLNGLKDLIVDLPMLKLADDDIIDDLTRSLSDLVQVEPEQLREMHSVRERITEQADAILAQMADFVA